jgi:hypothetical protein
MITGKLSVFIKHTRPVLRIMIFFISPADLLDYATNQNFKNKDFSFQIESSLNSFWETGGELVNTGSGTFWSQSPENEKAAPESDSETADSKDINGGADGARTRDLQRDRLAF